MAVSLSVRLNLVIVVLLCGLLAAGTASIVASARKAVAREMESTVKLTLELLAAASATADVGNPHALQRALAERLATLRKVRHLDIAVLNPEGGPMLVPMRPTGLSAETDAPEWFVRWVLPATVEYRHRISAPGMRVGEIAIRPNPADEIAEAWDESRTSLALLTGFAALVITLVYITINRAFRPVERILDALSGIEKGDYSARLPKFRLRELDRIATHVNNMVEELDRKDDENRRLSQRALAIQEAERRHLAQELHDQLGQSVSAIKALAVSIRKDAGAEVRDNASTITSICDQVFESVRAMMRLLRPAVLDELGLVSALEQMAEEWNSHHDETACHLSVEGEVDTIAGEIAINVYRIVQECLTNVARHAKATEVGVHLARDAENSRLRLEIEDDGVGFDPEKVRQGLGLLGIRERVRSLGGEMILAAGADGGSAVRIAIPLTNEAAEPRTSSDDGKDSRIAG